MRKAVLISVVLVALPTSARPQVVTAAQVNGTWNYKNNLFRVWALGNQRLKVEFEGTYEYKAGGRVMANTGTGSGIAVVEGIVASFKPEGADDGCKIAMTFKADRLVVDQKDGCGFGLNVIASGTYRKTSSRKPSFND